MEQRLLLAFVLMGLVLFLTPYFYKAPPPPAKTTAPASSQASPATAPAVPKTAEAAPAAPATPVPGQIVAPSEQQFVVDTDIYRITLSNRGGTVRSWILKKYHDKEGKPLET